MKKLQLTNTQSQWEQLHAALDKTRKSKAVKVDAEALRSLLMDHSKLLELHKVWINA